MAYQLTKEDLLQHLKEQIQFLQLSIKSYDEGYIAESKRMAAVIRTLLHDTYDSKSLLKQLEIKDDMLFYDTSNDYDENNLVTHLGFIGMEINTNDDGTFVRYFPYCDTLNLIKKNDWISFDKWWSKVVISDNKGRLFTRKDCIKFGSNMDGGSHVDPILTEKFSQLTRFGSLGFVAVTDVESISIDLNPLTSCIRHMCYELMESLGKAGLII